MADDDTILIIPNFSKMHLIPVLKCPRETPLEQLDHNRMMLGKMEIGSSIIIPKDCELKFIPIESVWDDIVEFNDRWFPDWKETPLVHLTNAMAGEMGELCNASKHLAGGGTNKERDVHMSDLLYEMADVYIYMALIAMTLEIPAGEFLKVIKSKMRINEKRMADHKAKTEEVAKDGPGDTKN